MRSKELVREYLQNASGIAFDGCHKVYILMDSNQMELMKQYGYEHLIPADTNSVEELFDQIAEWYNGSCYLRFVEAVATVEGNPNDGFTVLIPQGE